MNPTIKARIESIRRGEVPEGYKRTKIGIVPNEWNVESLKSHLIEYRHLSNDIDKFDIYSSSRNGLMLQSAYYSQKTATQTNLGYKTVPNGYVTYRHMSDDDIFHFNINRQNKTILVSAEYPVFDTDDQTNTYFLITYLNSMARFRYFCRGQKMGGTRTRLYFNVLGDFKLAFPSISEQEKIAEILAGQDRVIALKEKLLAEKQKQKKYLMQQLLTGKKRLPGFSGKRKNFRLFDLCQIIADGDWIESKDQSDRGVRLIQTGNIGIGQFLNKFNKAHYISEETFTRLSCCEVFPGDVLLSRLPDPIGRACIIPKLNCRMITAVDCTILRFKKEVFADLFVYYSCLDAWQNKMVLLSGGSTRKRITRKEIENAVIALPIDEKEQITIAEILSTADKEIELLKKDIEQEKLKKKSLMQLLLTGIVRVL